MDVGARIRRARVAACFSLRDTAAQAGVSAQAISKYERGLDMPGSLVLQKLAAALGVSVEFLLRDQVIGEIRPDFRKRARLGAKLQASIIERIGEWLERYVDVERLAFGRCVPTELPEQFPYQVSTISGVEDAATSLRREWELGLDPIENMTELLEDREIKILALPDAPDDFDACTFRAQLDGCELSVIVVRGGLAGERQRFNLAHELGHLALRPTAGLDPEKAAHRFAGAFLCPASTARRELGVKRHLLSSDELLLLKLRYGMSVRAWVHRAADLNIISDSAARFAYIRLNQSWGVKEEPRRLPEETATRMERLVWRLLAEEAVTRSRAAELLARSIWDLDRPVKP